MSKQTRNKQTIKQITTTTAPSQIPVLYSGSCNKMFVYLQAYIPSFCVLFENKCFTDYFNVVRLMLIYVAEQSTSTFDVDPVSDTLA